MRHLPIDSLIGYAEGRLTPQKKDTVDRHITDCATCFAEVCEWSSIFRLMKADDLESAPESAIRQCLAIYQIEKPDSLLRQIFAAVVFDSAMTPAVVGIRGVSDSQQILLRADEVDVHLRVGGSPRVILGQILQRPMGDFVAGARVILKRGEERVATTLTDALGEFRFATAPSGRVRLQADVPAAFRLFGDFTIKPIENLS